MVIRIAILSCNAVLVQLVLPECEKVLLAQDVHSEAPATLLNLPSNNFHTAPLTHLPASQAVHAVEPTWLVVRPSGQNERDLERCLHVLPYLTIPALVVRVSFYCILTRWALRNTLACTMVRISVLFAGMHVWLSAQ